MDVGGVHDVATLDDTAMLDGPLDKSESSDESELVCFPNTVSTAMVLPLPFPFVPTAFKLSTPGSSRIFANPANKLLEVQDALLDGLRSGLLSKICTCFWMGFALVGEGVCERPEVLREYGMVRAGMATLARVPCLGGTPTLREVGDGDNGSSCWMCVSTSGIEITVQREVSINF